MLARLALAQLRGPELRLVPPAITIAWAIGGRRRVWIVGGNFKWIAARAVKSPAAAAAAALLQGELTVVRGFCRQRASARSLPPLAHFGSGLCHASALGLHHRFSEGGRGLASRSFSS